jgi:hypothetical protein
VINTIKLFTIIGTHHTLFLNMTSRTFIEGLKMYDISNAISYRKKDKEHLHNDLYQLKLNIWHMSGFSLFKISFKHNI